MKNGVRLIGWLALIFNALINNKYLLTAEAIKDIKLLMTNRIFST